MFKLLRKIFGRKKYSDIQAETTHCVRCGKSLTKRTAVYTGWVLKKDGELNIKVSAGFCNHSCLNLMYRANPNWHETKWQETDGMRII